MKNIRVIIDSEFKGIDSGWPLRYVGIMRELYKKYRLSIFAPGDCGLLKQLFTNAEVGKNTSNMQYQIPQNLSTLIKSVFSRSIKNIQIDGHFFYEEFMDYINEDRNVYDATIYFGMSAVVCYANNKTNELKICDFGDSRLRSIYTQIERQKKLSHKVKLHMKSHYLKIIKKRFVPDDIVISAITKEDEKCIGSALRKNLIVTVPNGVDIHKDDLDEHYLSVKHNNRSVLFLGTLNYPPNIESVLFSVKNVMPRIWKQFPDTEFIVVGRNPVENIKEISRIDNRIKLNPDVESTIPFYENATLFLGPIFSGAGMKNKFMESLSFGTPIITTEEGAIGISMTDGDHGRICNNARDMADAVGAIFNGSLDEYEKLSKNCHVAAKQHSWENAIDGLVQLIER